MGMLGHGPEVKQQAIMMILLCTACTDSGRLDHRLAHMRLWQDPAFVRRIRSITDINKTYRMNFK